MTLKCIKYPKNEIEETYNKLVKFIPDEYYHKVFSVKNPQYIDNYIYIVRSTNEYLILAYVLFRWLASSDITRELMIIFAMDYDEYLKTYDYLVSNYSSIVNQIIDYRYDDYNKFKDKYNEFLIKFNKLVLNYFDNYSRNIGNILYYQDINIRDYFTIRNTYNITRNISKVKFII